MHTDGSVVGYDVISHTHPHTHTHMHTKYMMYVQLQDMPGCVFPYTCTACVSGPPKSAADLVSSINTKYGNQGFNVSTSLNSTETP